MIIVGSIVIALSGLSLGIAIGFCIRRPMPEDPGLFASHLWSELIAQAKCSGAAGNVAQEQPAEVQDEDLYYIQSFGPPDVPNTDSYATWWKVDGWGYTYDLRKAWQLPKEIALSHCRPGQDVVRRVKDVKTILVSKI